ncbi:MAG: rRNA pseudouridine synthase [Alphaproteobacteria bacterium]|nr:rRNA pseudouridine synthase [Alphaproteobacteria bacterium]
MPQISKAPVTGDRIAKFIARAGLCSRRMAETWIMAGRVAVNGEKVMTPAFTVTPADTIQIDGKPLVAKAATRMWLYHKPAGRMVTEQDPEGRPTVFEAFAKHGLPRVLTVGRLDYNTEGLLLLTNDGGLKRVLELPTTGWARRYRVRAFGKIEQGRLDQLRHGITVDKVHYGAIQATLERVQGDNVWMLITLREGKNREVKNVLGTLGLQVNRLIRVSFGPFQLGELKPGEIEQVRTKVLKDQLGQRLAEKAEVDFDAGPRRERLNSALNDEVPPPGGRQQKIHFTDGRPAEKYVPPPVKRKRDGQDGKPGRPKPTGPADRGDRRPRTRRP